MPQSSTLSEDTEKLLSQELKPALTEDKESRSWRPLITASIYALAFIASVSLGALVGNYWLANPDRVCIRHTSQYSPILSDLDITYSINRFNGSLMKETIYRKDASPEVDAAWEALGVNYRSVRVPYEEAERSGLALDQVQINSKYGGGFPANVEGLHHLHCLNLLRQSLFYNYDYYHSQKTGAFKNDDHIVRHHVSHCLDFLRQQLMCTVDIGVLGQVWIYPQTPTAFVDFNTQHKCRNFEAIRKWAEERQLPEEVPFDFLEPPKPGGRIYPEIP